jgi:hypothetical protein
MQMLRAIAGTIVLLALLYMADQVFADGRYTKASMRAVHKVEHSLGIGSSVRR